MKNAVAGLIAVAGLAAAAAGQSEARLDWKVNAGAGWFDDVTVFETAGVEVEVGLFVGWTPGANRYGFNKITADCIVTNWANGSDVATVAGGGYGRQPQFDFGALVVTQYTSSGTASPPQPPGSLRLGAANNANWAAAGGLAITQRDPAFWGTAFITDNPAFVFKFKITLGGSETARDIDINTMKLNNNRVTVYQSSTSSASGVTNITPVDLLGAVIHVVPIPTPGSLALLGLGGLVAGRRRR